MLGFSAIASVLPQMPGVMDPDARSVPDQSIELQKIAGRTITMPAVLTAEQEKAAAAEPGSYFKECSRGCPLMVVIPPGKFRMGAPDGESDPDAKERPQHDVTITKPFAVSKFEVTFENWDACVAAGACAPAADSWGRGDMPVINVSWGEAKEYVNGSRGSPAGSIDFWLRQSGSTPRVRAL